MTYEGRWADFPSYILEITEEIWRGRAIGTLDRYYAADIPVRTPMGVSRGNRATMRATMAMLTEFPDRQGHAEDVIWSDHPEHGLLSSHRGVSVMTHGRDGPFGSGTGTRLSFRVIADCAVRGIEIYDEWLVRDYGAIARQLGRSPEAQAAALIAAEGGAERAAMPFLPEHDVAGDYAGQGNDDEWGLRYADLLTRIMAGEARGVPAGYDRAVQGEYSGAVHGLGVDDTAAFWLGLRSAFPDAAFAIHHRIGMGGGMLPPRAAIRWSLDGAHDGWGAFGAPTGARVHVMGIAHAEFGPRGIRRETALHDEVAIWKQILIRTGGAS